MVLSRPRKEFHMIRTKIQRRRVRPLFAFATFFVVLLASTTSPAFAQASGTWTSTANLNIARAGHTSTLLPNGQVLVAGGENATGFLASAELYNLSTGQWTVTGSMATPRINHKATLLPNG